MSAPLHAGRGLARLVGMLAAAACGAASRPDRANAQVIQPGAAIRREVHGTVTDSASHLPIAGVEILFDQRPIATTDSAGHYHAAGSLPANTTLGFRRLGYRLVIAPIDLTRSTAVLDVAMAVNAVALETVTTRLDTAAATFLRANQATAAMTAQDVQQQRGQTLGETIKSLPGVSIIQYGPSIAKPVVRGLHSQRIATVSAGVPQEGQQWGGEHAPEIDAFAANEIEVIRGPGTILYGSGALGGVVRVTPRPLPKSGSTGGEFSTNAFANNRQGAASLLLEGAHLYLPGVGDLGWRIQGSARRAGDAKTPTYYLPNTGFKELDYNTAVGLTRAWGSSQLDYSHFGTTLGLYAGAHVGNLDDLNRAMESAFTTDSFSYTVARPDQSVRHDLFAWHTNVNLRNASRLEVSYGFQDNLRREYDNHGFAVGARPAFALELFTHSLDVQYHHAPIGAFSGTVGVSGMRQGNLSPGRSFLIPQYRLYTGGVFALEQYTKSKLTLTVGARHDDRWQHAYQYGAPVVVSPEERRNYTGPSGSLGGSYQLTSAWSLASTLTHAWRPPNVNERFSQGVHHGTAQYEIGDSSLVPERSMNADFTLRHLGLRTRLELSTYQNHIDGFIFLRPRDPVATVRGIYPAYNYAQTNALLRGVELTGQIDPVWWVALYANVNVVRGTDRASDTPLYDMPADRITTSMRFFGESRRWLNAPYVEIGSTIVRAQTRVPPVTIYKLPTSGYALLNLDIGATSIDIGHLHLEPSLAVHNVFDRRYRDYLSRYRLFVDEPGRDLVLRLTVPFGPTRR